MHSTGEVVWCSLEPARFFPFALIQEATESSPSVDKSATSILTQVRASVHHRYTITQPLQMNCLELQSDLGIQSGCNNLQKQTNLTKRKGI